MNVSKFKTLAIFTFCLTLLSSLSAQITFDSSFESGNGTNFILTGTNEYSFEIEPDTNSTDRQWYYFSVSGANGTQLTFRLQNINTTNVPNHWTTAHPVASADNGLSWNHINGTTLVSGSEYIFSHTPSGDTELIAYHFPYTWSRKKAAVALASNHPHVTASVIGSSVQGREIDMLEITNPDYTPPSGKLGFWLVARQHGAEVTGSWQMEGFLEFLLSNDPEAEVIRQMAITRVIPMLNPDGAFAGNYRDNYEGQNLNRSWDNPSALLTPEIQAATQAIDSWVSGGNPLDYFADLHSTSGPHPHFAYYASSSIEPPLYHDPPNYYEDTKQFLALIDQHEPAFKDTTGASSSTDQRLARQWVTFQYGTLAFTFEGGYNKVNDGPDSNNWMTPAVHKAVGEAIGRALYDFYSFPSGLPADYWMLR